MKREVYTNLFKYFENEEMARLQTVVGSFSYQNNQPGYLLFMKGDTAPRLAYLLLQGKIALCKAFSNSQKNIRHDSHFLRSKELFMEVLMDKVYKYIAKVQAEETKHRRSIANHFLTKLLMICEQYGTQVGQSESSEPTEESSQSLQSLDESVLDKLILKKPRGEKKEEPESVSQVEPTKRSLKVEEAVIPGMEEVRQNAKVQEKQLIIPPIILIQNLEHFGCLAEYLSEEKCREVQANKSVDYLLDHLMAHERFRLAVVEYCYGEVINILTPGLFFGDRIFGAEKQRTVSAVILEPADLFVINRPSYVSIFKNAIEEELNKKIQFVKRLCPEAVGLYSKSHFRNIIYAGVLKDFKKGEVVNAEGDCPRNTIMFIFQGQVSLQKRLYTHGLQELFEKSQKKQMKVLTSEFGQIEREYKLQLINKSMSELLQSVQNWNLNTEIELCKIGQCQVIGQESILWKQRSLFTSVCDTQVQLMCFKTADIIRLFPKPFLQGIQDEYKMILQSRLSTFVSKSFELFQASKLAEETFDQRAHNYLAELVKPGQLRSFNNQKLQEVQAQKTEELLAGEQGGDRARRRKLAVAKRLEEQCKRRIVRAAQGNRELYEKVDSLNGNIAEVVKHHSEQVDYTMRDIFDRKQLFGNVSKISQNASKATVGSKEQKKETRVNNNSTSSKLHTEESVMYPWKKQIDYLGWEQQHKQGREKTVGARSQPFKSFSESSGKTQLNIMLRKLTGDNFNTVRSRPKSNLLFLTQHSLNSNSFQSNRLNQTSTFLLLPPDPRPLSQNTRKGAEGSRVMRREVFTSSNLSASRGKKKPLSDEKQCVRMLLKMRVLEARNGNYMPLSNKLGANKCN